MMVSELLIDVKDCLKNDTNIAAFCQEKYSKNLSIFLGVDVDDPPKQDDYPLVVIFQVSRASRGDSSKYSIYQLLLGVGVINGSKDITESNVVVLSGSLEVEQLRELIEAALISSKIAPFIDVVGDTSSEILFPLFRSDTLIEFKFVQSMGKSAK